jgi:hypothetical protein
VIVSPVVSGFSRTCYFLALEGTRHGSQTPRPGRRHSRDLIVEILIAGLVVAGIVMMGFAADLIGSGRVAAQGREWQQSFR